METRPREQATSQTPQSSVSSRLPATPTSASSSRISIGRSSIGSTSSGRRRSLRKDQSLHDLAESLGQQTPDRSKRADVISPTRSRQLDFENDGADDNAGEGVNVTDDGGAVSGPDGAETGASGNEQSGETTETLTPRRKKARRKTVFWTMREEEFLRQGVRKHGVGRWKKILRDGKDVFLEHRTNVDLKDKWKNLLINIEKKRRRRRSSAAATVLGDANEDGMEEPRTPQTSSLRQQKKRRSSSVPGTESDRSDRPNSPTESRLHASENENEVSSDYTTPKPRRKAAVLGADAMVAVATAEESEAQPSLEIELHDQFDAGFSPSHDDEAADEFESEVGETQDLRGLERRNRSDGVAAVPEMLSGVVTLRFATDESFPELSAVSVDLNTCLDVSALKEHLRSSVLSSAPVDADVQLIGLESRCLLGDEEGLPRCISKNGQAFYVVVGYGQHAVALSMNMDGWK